MCKELGQVPLARTLKARVNAVFRAIGAAKHGEDELHAY
jgi:hypothetical protein